MKGTNPLSSYTGPGNNYFASAGSSMEWLATETGGPPNGVFQVAGPAIGLRDITDGSSNTIAFGEWRVGTGNQNITTIPTDIVMLGSLPSTVTRNTQTVNMPLGSGGLLTWLQQCSAGASAAANRGPKTPTQGESWGLGEPGHSLGNLLIGPNAKYPNCNDSTGAGNGLNHAGHYGMSSRHSGGANVLLGDGSVRFLRACYELQQNWGAAL